jgi:hypothetical protein
MHVQSIVIALDSVRLLWHKPELGGGFVRGRL